MIWKTVKELEKEKKKRNLIKLEYVGICNNVKLHMITIFIYINFAHLAWVIKVRTRDGIKPEQHLAQPV